jgi:hypothetical protein
MTRRIAPSALVLAYLTACSAQTFVVQPIAGDAAEAADASRGVLRDLRSHAYADEVGKDLDRVERWLRDAEERIADGDDDSEVTQLTLLAVRAQLSTIKSFYTRREAERALDDARGGYDLERTQLRDLESQNETLLKGER